MIHIGFRFIDSLAPLKLCGRSFQVFRQAWGSIGISSDANRNKMEQVIWHQSHINHWIPIGNSGMAIECFWFTLCDALVHSSVLAKSNFDRRICFELSWSPWQFDCRRFCVDNDRYPWKFDRQQILSAFRSWFLCIVGVEWCSKVLQGSKFVAL